MRENRSHAWSLLLGGLLSVTTLAVYAFILLWHGRPDPLRSLAYNSPIAFVFLVLAIDVAIRAVRAPETFGTDEWPTVVAWVFGATVLYLRLVEKSVEISGHMVWLPLLSAQAWARGFPRWFVGIAVGSTLAALYMKIAIFGGPSGIPGTVIGIVVAAAFLGMEMKVRTRRAARGE